MKNLLLAAVAFAALVAGPAMAADQRVKAPVHKAPPPPVFSWSGCYLGGNGGWIGGHSEFALGPAGRYLAGTGFSAPPNTDGTGDFATDIAALSNSYKSNNSSFEGGVQVGCNNQLGPAVFGFEADWQKSNLSNTVDASFAAFPNVGNPIFTDAAHIEHVTSKLDWFSTFRGRLGFTPIDSLLLYGTAGFVIADIKSDTAVNFGTFPFAPVYNGASHVGSASKSKFGIVAGAGAEWAFAPSWSAKAEFLYFELVDSLIYLSPLVAAVPAFAPGYAWNTKVNLHEVVARAGINYHFSAFGH
jgi:outer membrane immunogenic protein